MLEFSGIDGRIFCHDAEVKSIFTLCLSYIILFPNSYNKCYLIAGNRILTGNLGCSSFFADKFHIIPISIIIFKTDNRGIGDRPLQISVFCAVVLAAQKGITMSIADETEGNAFICGDMTMLMRLMLNLIDNAILYGKKNGTVQVGLSRCKEQLRIKVTDDGIGISAEHLDKIWNRFYRVDKSRSGGEGFGLGLHMVKWIAELHGGTITVDSVPEVGTTFTVLL